MDIYGLYGRVIPQDALEDKFNDYASRKLFLVADEEVIRQRMQYARKYSEADYNVYLHLKTVYEKMNRPCLYLHSDQLSLSDMMEQVEKYTGISKDVGAGDN